jgi:Zinc knuckle
LEIDGKIARVKELITKREELDAEISELLGGGATREKRSPKCSICGVPGHRASTCPEKPIEAKTTEVVQ